MQIGIPPKILLMSLALIWTALVFTALPQVVREPISAPSRRNWILAIFALPLVGVFAWFIKKYRDLP